MHTLYTDGGARGNPGPAGVGAVLLDHSGTVVQEISQYIGEATNNQAEYTALILGLEAASVSGITQICVLADSELMVRQMKGEYRVKHPDLKPLYVKAKELASRFQEFQIRHVRREQNSHADALVNQAIDAHV